MKNEPTPKFAISMTQSLRKTSLGKEEGAVPFRQMEEDITLVARVHQMLHG